MKEIDDPNSLAGFIEKCRQNSLKITPQRTAIFKTLTEAKNHPSADIVYQEVRAGFPNISFDTVNRTLMTFAEIGIIDLVEGRGDPRRFDPNLTPHHHFYCVRCGKIRDFYIRDMDQIELPEDIVQKFSIISKRLVLNGYCDQCKKEG